MPRFVARPPPAMLLVLLGTTMLVLGLGAEGAPGEWPRAEEVAGSRPNVLVLFADDLGYGDLSVNGHPTILTPALDRLAASGVRFTQWYSGFHVCSPSRASMMTGRLPVRVGTAGASWTGGVFNSDSVGGLPENETTVADLLRAQGYRTKAVGKWHLGQQPKFLPTAHGFDEYYGIPYSDDMGSSAWDRYTSRDRPALPLVSSQADGTVTVLEQPTNLNLLSSRYVNESIKFMKSGSAKEAVGDDSQHGAPWFLYVAFNHVHVPNFASQDFCNTSIRGRFGDAIQELDDAVGAIVSAIPSPDDTIIFFTSDNGPWLVKRISGGSAGVFRDGKETTWEGGVREPGIIAWPGKIRGGRISHQVVATYDIFATAVALAGGTLPDDRVIDGKDLSPVLFGSHRGNAALPTNAVHPCIFIYKGTPGLGCPTDHPNCPGLWATRCGAYKLHRVTSNTTFGSRPNQGVFHDPPLIYNVEQDPGESYPLDPASAEYKAQRASIEAAMSAHEATLRPVPNQMASGLNPDLRVCCDRSKNCICNPENFEVFVCSPVGDV